MNKTFPKNYIIPALELTLCWITTYKNFWEKSLVDLMRLLIWPEWEREKESQTKLHQKVFSSFCQELLLNPKYEFGDQTEGRKN